MQKISIDELKQLGQGEGLVLQGCGGDLAEWVDGINKVLTDEEILKDGSTFSDVRTFEHDGLTNLVFVMGDDVKFNMGKLAMWRLATHENFGGTWLSDYLPNRLGYHPQSQGMHGDDDHDQDMDDDPGMSEQEMEW